VFCSPNDCATLIRAAELAEMSLSEYLIGLKLAGRVESVRTRCRRTVMTNADLMASFCSLGGNREFGAAQRAYGVEPPDLFRWAILEMPALLELLARRFDGIGDDLAANPPNTKGGFMIRSQRYGFRRHAWTRRGEIPVDVVLADAAARLPQLAKELVDDLGSSHRIFVRLPDARGNEHGIDRLVTLIRQYGEAPLLFVAKETPEHPAGTVEHVGNGLLRGYNSRFADPNNVMATTPAAEWLGLCRAARAMVDEHGRA
jgi:hypothetical protein